MEHVGGIKGHGTHVAGRTCAAGNVVNGVNKHVKILPVGIFSIVQNKSKYQCIGAYDIDIISALEYVTELKTGGVNIVAVNLSLGAWNEEYLQYSPYFLAVDAASKAGDTGILICMAAGNEGQDIDNPKGKYKYYKPYPAYFGKDVENSLCVGASDSDNRLSAKASSNYSSTGKSVSVFAPGEDILSTCLNRSVYCTASGDYSESLAYSEDGCTYISGTSMAVPFVAGAAALLASAYPGKTAGEIKELLTSTATSVCREGYSQYGQIDIAAAIGGRQPAVSPDVPEDPEEPEEPSIGGGGGGGCNAMGTLLGCIAVFGMALLCLSEKR